MAYNIPGMFRMAQGVPPPAPRYGPVMQGFDGGWTYNIPGYDGITAEDFTSVPGGTTPPDGSPPQGTVVGESIYIRHLAAFYGMTVDEAATQWEDMKPDAKQFIIDDYFGRDDKDGSGSGLAGTYAQIAENSRQFNEQMAFERERAQQEDRVARWQAEVTKQQAMQDFYSARDNATLSRKQIFNDAAGGALAAQARVMGQANIPGIENYRLDGSGGNVLSNAPIIRTDPSLAYGQQIQTAPDMPVPNIPGVSF